MILDITQKLITYYKIKDNDINPEHIDVADDRIRRFVDPNKRDEFYNAYVDKYSIFPNASRIFKILEENPSLKIKTDYIHSEYSEKTEHWGKTNLFREQFFLDGTPAGEYCILCGSGKNWTRQSCIITERDKQGYEMNQLCACAGGDPQNLQLYHEWIAENTRRKEDNKPLIDYNRFYKQKYDKKTKADKFVNELED